MYIECPECKSCFFVEDKNISPKVSHFRCGVCKNVFVKKETKNFFGSNFFWKIKIFTRKIDKVRASMFIAVIFAFYLCVCVLWGARGYFEAKYPAVNAWLTFFGISEQSRFSNFDFRNVRQQVLSEEGTKFLEITGLILNISDTAMNVPAVEAEIFDSEGRKTESKVIYPQERLLRPKESVSFRMRVLLMDNDSSEAELRFIQNKELSK